MTTGGCDSAGSAGPKGDTGPQGPARCRDGVGLPTVTAEDNGMYAGVVDGAWGKVSAPGGGGEWNTLHLILPLPRMFRPYQFRFRIQQRQSGYR